MHEINYLPDPNRWEALPGRYGEERKNHLYPRGGPSGMAGKPVKVSSTHMANKSELVGAPRQESDATVPDNHARRNIDARKVKKNLELVDQTPRNKVQLTRGQLE